jgi:hypothetical protein
LQRPLRAADVDLDYEAVVRFWVRPDSVAGDLGRRLLAALVPWLRNEFAFTHVLFEF